MWRTVFVLVGIAFGASSTSWFVAARRSRERSRFLARMKDEEVQRRYWRAVAAKDNLIGGIFVTVAVAVLGVAVEPNVRFADFLLLASAAPLVLSLAWLDRFRWAAAVSEMAAETEQKLRESHQQADQLSAHLADRLSSCGLETPSLTVSSIYFPAEGLVGGDFLGCAVLPGGSVGLLIGDVTGHGLHAAIDAIRLKDLTMAVFLQGASPADVLQHANAHLCRDGEMMATAFVAVIDGCAIRYASAGHVSTLVNGPTGARLLEPTGRILGVAPDFAISEATVAISPGDVIVAYTDGLLEAYGANGGLDPSEISELVSGGGFDQLRDVVKARGHLPLRDDIAAFEVCVRSSALPARRDSPVPPSARQRPKRPASAS